MKHLFVVPIVAIALLFVNPQINALEIASGDQTEVTTIIQEKFIALAPENLPQKVLEAVAKDFEGAIIENASAKEDASEFKLILKQGEKEMEVYCDADGNWISK